VSYPGRFAVESEPASIEAPSLAQRGLDDPQLLGTAYGLAVAGHALGKIAIGLGDQRREQIVKRRVPSVYHGLTGTDW
jgi:hypothetical protein